MYLHCNAISSFNQLAVAENSSIVKTINATVPCLGITTDNELSNFDNIDVSGKILRRLHFRTTDNLKR